MKILTIIVNENCQQDVADKLKLADIVDHFVLTQVQIHGETEEQNIISSMRDKVVGYVSKSKFEIIVKSERVSQLVELLFSVNGVRNQSKVWVTTVTILEAPEIKREIQ